MTSFIFKAVASGQSGFIRRAVIQAHDLRDAVDVASEDARIWASEHVPPIPETDVEVVAIRKGTTHE